MSDLTQFGLSPADAAALAPRVDEILAGSAPDNWMRMTREVLRPQHPQPLHRYLWQQCFAQWDADRGPWPVWMPGTDELERSNLARLQQELGLPDYEALFTWSVSDRSRFWGETISRLGVRFQTEPSSVLDMSGGAEYPRWLPGAQLNIVESCFQADPQATAIVAENEAGESTTWTYAQLLRETDRVARGVQQAGFSAGDALGIMMPMTPASVAIYLGIIKMGGVVVSIADSFAPPEIKTRLDLAAARGIFIQDISVRGGKRLPLFDKIVACDGPPAVVLPAESTLGASLREGDKAWADFLPDDDAPFAALPRSPDDVTNLLFSSGTTGDPKAIPWTQTTPIKCAADGHLHHDVQPGDVVAWPTNLGWMMGPWLIYATLINGGRIALFDGNPAGADFCGFVGRAGVNMLGVIPSLVRAWRSQTATDGVDWSAIKLFSSTGECSNPEDMFFLMSVAGYRPVIEYCGGTEVGGGYITSTLLKPCAPATFTTAALGLDMRILDDEGRATRQGEVFLVPPSIGMSQRLIGRDHHEAYFADAPADEDGTPLRRHGDEIERLPGGFFRAHGRTDDTMNLGGIKVSSAEIERCLNQLDAVRETAAVAVSPPGGGPQQLVVFAVVTDLDGVDPDQLAVQMRATLKTELNPLFKLQSTVLVDSLPRTASNKVMRRVLRAQWEANEVPSPPSGQEG